MPAYRNLGGDSNVVAFDFDPAADWIEVEFAGGKFTIYRYEAAKIGRGNVQQMITLAQAGRGLNAYINTHKNIKGGYSSRR